jgi:ribosome-binding protein aMBF1 (putative translation factor)
MDIERRDMARSQKYSQKKVSKHINLTPTAIALYEEYAANLNLKLSELLEQVVRIPSVARGLAVFIENKEKSSKIA